MKNVSRMECELKCKRKITRTSQGIFKEKKTTTKI